MLNIFKYDNGNICIGIDETIITVNLGDILPPYCAYLDTNNIRNVEELVLTEYGIGKFTNFIGKSGYCTYPLYMFDKDKLAELSPYQLADYEYSLKLNKVEV